jgi:hypothetical protein
MNTKMDLLSVNFSKEELDDCVFQTANLVKEIYNITVMKKSRVEVQISLNKENLIYNKLNEDSSGSLFI